MGVDESGQPGHEKLLPDVWLCTHQPDEILSRGLRLNQQFQRFRDWLLFVQFRSKLLEDLVGVSDDVLQVAVCSV